MSTRPYKTHDGRVLVAEEVYSSARKANVILVTRSADRPAGGDAVALAVRATDKRYDDPLTSWIRWATPGAARWVVENQDYYPIYFELKAVPKVEVPAAAPLRIVSVSRELFDNARNAVVEAVAAFQTASRDLDKALGGVRSAGTSWIDVGGVRRVASALQEYAGLMEGIVAVLDEHVPPGPRESPRAALAGFSTFLAGVASAMAMRGVVRRALDLGPAFSAELSSRLVTGVELMRVAAYLVGAVTGPVAADIREALRTGRAFNAQEIRAISKAVA